METRDGMGRRRGKILNVDGTHCHPYLTPEYQRGVSLFTSISIGGLANALRSFRHELCRATETQTKANKMHLYAITTKLKTKLKRTLGLISHA